jgi:hypothetical protein
MKNIVRHLPHYFPLMGILVAAVIGFIYLPQDRMWQIAITVSMSVSYVVWGIVHHSMHKDFKPAVLLEYIVVALLGMVLVFSLLIK